MSVALSIRDLDVDLGGRPVLRGVNLDIHRGELAGVLGPNGAGKTTLLRSILGLVPRRSGRVFSEAGKVDTRSIGYVPQRHEFAWDMPLSVRDAVHSALTGKIGVLRRARREHYVAVETALERTEMAQMADRPVGELSGGQRQRVLVARALALQPQVLFLDEPMTGLDMPTQELLHQLFVDLAREGHALVMTTHDLVTAVAVMDRIHLVRGHVVASGTPSQLRDAQPWTQTFAVSTSNPLLAALGLECGAQQECDAQGEAAAVGDARAAGEAGTEREASAAGEPVAAVAAARSSS